MIIIDLPVFIARTVGGTCRRWYRRPL